MFTTAPPAFMWLVVAISILSIVIQVVLVIAKAIGYVISRNDRIYDARRKTEDTWFEAVVLDRVLPQFLEFLDKERAAFRQLDKSNYKEANSAFAQRVEEFKGSIVIVGVLSETTYTSLLETMDLLPDAMAQHCAANDGYRETYAKYEKPKAVLDAFDLCQNRCLATMRSMHLGAVERPGRMRDLFRRVVVWVRKN